MALDKNKQYFQRANNHLVGAVNSPVRAFKAVDTEPIAIVKAEDAYIFDANGTKYIDFLSAWGANIVGHSNDAVSEAISEAARSGTAFGLSSHSELELAELIKAAFSSIELLRLVNSGTEAVMSAIRAARSYTGKNGVIKFEGCYHGHSDSMLAKAGSGLSTFSISGSAGVPSKAIADTYIAEYNNIESVKRIIDENSDIACIIIEPIAGNMGVVPPKSGFLEQLRALADKSGVLLIFDEVITGFRVALGGAQQLYAVEPDMTILGKIIGAGLPIGAFGGKKEVMQCLSPEGDAYQAGTFSGNPVVTAAGRAVLKQLFENPPYKKLEQLGAYLEYKLNEKILQNNLNISINRAGSMFTIFQTPQNPQSYDDVKSCDTKSYAEMFSLLLKKGILLPPSQFESAFITSMHTKQMLDELIDVFSL